MFGVGERACPANDDGREAETCDAESLSLDLEGHGIDR